MVPRNAMNNTTAHTVNEQHQLHQQVYLLSFAKDDALTQWMRKLNTAMIIGPGARTSGFREPSAPYMVSKSHRSLTVMWLPPRQPYLNSVHSFQVRRVVLGGGGGREFQVGRLALVLRVVGREFQVGGWKWW